MLAVLDQFEKNMTLASIFNYKYLDKHQLNGFENYKYSSIDTNPIGIYVMHPFWNKLVEVSKSLIFILSDLPSVYFHVIIYS